MKARQMLAPITSTTSRWLQLIRLAMHALEHLPSSLPISMNPLRLLPRVFRERPIKGSQSPWPLRWTPPAQSDSFSPANELLGVWHGQLQEPIQITQPPASGSHLWWGFRTWQQNSLPLMSASLEVHPHWGLSGFIGVRTCVKGLYESKRVKANSALSGHRICAQARRFAKIYSPHQWRSFVKLTQVTQNRSSTYLIIHQFLKIPFEGCGTP